MEEKKLTGYPSIDKPWLKYYSEEAIHAPLPECTAFERICRGNDGHPDDIALIYFDRKITYRQLFDGIERAAKAFAALGIAQGDIVILCVVNMPEAVYALYALDRLGAVANLIDPRTNAEQLRNYINECDAKLVVTVDLAYSIIQQASNETTVERIITISPADSLPPVKRIAYLLKNKAPALASGDMCWADFIARGALYHLNMPHMKRIVVLSLHIPAVQQESQRASCSRMTISMPLHMDTSILIFRSSGSTSILTIYLRSSSTA